MAGSSATAVAITETIQMEPTLQMRLQMPHPPRGIPGAGPSKIRNRLRLDPSRALEPARKKIATIEAQRVMSVFEETISRIEQISMLPYIIRNIDRFHVSLGSDLTQQLEQHRVIQESYQEIKDQLDMQMRQHRNQRRGVTSVASSVKSVDPDQEVMDDARSQYSEEGGQTEQAAPTTPPTNGTETKEMDEVFEEEARSQISEKRSLSRQSVMSGGSAESFDSQIERTMRSLSLVAQQLSTSCKNILRSFAQNHSALKTIKTQANIPAPNEQLVFFMNELKDILMNKLLTTPEEEKERMEYIHEVSLRERNNAVVIEKLEEELKAALADKEEEIKKKNEVVRRLQADLHQIEKFSEENMNRVKKEAEKQEAADIKSSDSKKQRLLQELTQLKTQLQNLITEHRENEQDLRRRKFRVESQVENLIQKFDSDMSEKQNEYEEIDAVYTEEKKQLHELDERFKTLETEYQQIMEERRIAREKRETAERELANMIKASTTIQAFWRSFKVRKALKARKKKGGGKKKK